MAGVQLCREIGNSAALNPFAKREVMPRVTTGNTMARTVRRSWPTDQPVAISSHIIRTAPR
ncbi:MAG: hypothetical protein QOI29_3991 [Mycobacterium sp.]|nr:hypothetical protein [Mycobacterium sp.]